VYSAKLINTLIYTQFQPQSARLSQVVVGASSHKDKGELSVLASFTNLDNRTRVCIKLRVHKSNNND
jgi:hypothetical protein